MRKKAKEYVVAVRVGKETAWFSFKTETNRDAFLSCLGPEVDYITTEIPNEKAPIKRSKRHSSPKRKPKRSSV